MDINDNLQRIKKHIASLTDLMKKYPNPSEIEEIKKAMKGSVRFFDRKNLLAYLLMQSLNNNEPLNTNPQSNRAFRAKSQNNEAAKETHHVFEKKEASVLHSQPSDNHDSISLWTNAFFHNDEKKSEFTRFVATKASIDPKNIYDIRKIKNFSFIDVDKNSSGKILAAFSKPVEFGKYNVTIKVARGQNKG